MPALRRRDRVEHIKWATLRAAMPLLEPFYSGIAAVPTFHRVVPPSTSPRLGWVRDLEASPVELEGTVILYRRLGYSFVTMDEMLSSLSAPARRRAPKLAVMTFDDGYADNFTTAYPLLGSMGVPFTLYVATAFPDRSVTPWWYLLEDVLTHASSFGFDHAGKTWAWTLDGHASRERAFAEADAVFARRTPSDARALANRTFGAERVAAVTDTLSVTWENLAEMAASGRVALGGHTVDHVHLPPLAEDEARRQMTAGKRRIEERTAAKVAHFAYPFGAVGPREVRLAREIGFASAVTAMVSNIFRGHRHHPHALPRIYGAFGEKQELQLRGAWTAMMNRGRRVVTLGAG